LLQGLPPACASHSSAVRPARPSRCGRHRSTTTTTVWFVHHPSACPLPAAAWQDSRETATATRAALTGRARVTDSPLMPLSYGGDESDRGCAVVSPSIHRSIGSHACMHAVRQLARAMRVATGFLARAFLIPNPLSIVLQACRFRLNSSQTQTDLD
jgi:hypothetical protein